MKLHFHLFRFFLFLSFYPPIFFIYLPCFSFFSRFSFCHLPYLSPEPFASLAIRLPRVATSHALTSLTGDDVINDVTTSAWNPLTLPVTLPASPLDPNRSIDRDKEGRRRYRGEETRGTLLRNSQLRGKIHYSFFFSVFCTLTFVPSGIRGEAFEIKSEGERERGKNE